MALMERFTSLFSIGKYSQCSSLNKETSDKRDDLYSQWINSSNLISSQFMMIYLEDEVVTKKKTEPLIKELQSMVNQIRSAPTNARLLQLELSVLYNILYIRTFNDDGLLNIEGDTELITQTLYRVICHHERRSCSGKQDIGELLVTALQQSCKDVILTPLICICCLWMVLMCRLDKTDQVIQVMDHCLQLHILQCLELSPLVLLPLPLLLTGEQYVDDNSFISDMVSLTAGMIYYKTDHLKSRECMERVVSPTYKPYTKYLIASINYSGGNYVEVLTTLCSLSEDISMTNRVKALHCHLFGMTLSKLDKHQCAIQKYKEALDEDFSFMLPLFMIAIEYRSLNFTAAELESLNLLVTALGNSKQSKEHNRSLFTLLVEDTCGKLTLFQIMYFLANRCSQLKMYADAAQRYLDLLTYNIQHTYIQISGNQLVEIPRIENIYLEAVHCLHQAKMYNECIAVCDQVLNCFPSQSQNVSLNCSTQSDLGLMSGDNNLHNISDIICDEVEVKSSQDCTKRKRHQTEESVKDGGEDIIISLYKADCFVFLGKIEVGVQCLDRCRERLPFSADWNQEVKVHHHSKRQRISSDGDATSQTEYSESISDLQKLGSSVYCHVGVAVATRGQGNDALHFLRIGLRLNPGNLDVLYNYVVVLWSVNKKDAAITWCQGRNIETASDSFHLTSLLKQKRNRLRSLTGKDFFRETDIGPSITVTDEYLLKLDVLCLNVLIS